MTVSVGVFRPDDARLTQAVELLEELGTEPVPDPMLAVEPTDAIPRSDADYTVLTSKTGVELAAHAGWTPPGAVCAIGSSTADSLRAYGYSVDIIPDQFTSSGLVAALSDRVDGARVDVARSDHGSPVLTDGLEDAGAYVHETVLYRLTRPPRAGVSTELAATGEIDAVLFTSSLTVDHFLDAASERGLRETAIDGLGDAVIGAIGPPTQRTAENAGIDVDVVSDRADFEALARTVVDRLSERV
ncbi:uroporphyrinogen-III synthase [Halocatena pleomorpha]|uniref:Uroporphyrinogen-III synthase n=1 Tax=Halocatena pleomorpha TaxID=1785090 RepID=A0A3P3RE73_9EURY|nr:uroporphyrinogen-III synthase [Halocatena pleomorpha]RRJ30723.1 uroporphyrinogen-III synthase [Halocatena pleomorpha]